VHYESCNEPCGTRTRGNLLGSKVREEEAMDRGSTRDASGMGEGSSGQSSGEWPMASILRR
jgi:hypothetical protein